MTTDAIGLLDLADRVERGDDSYEVWSAIIDACDMSTPCGDPLTSLDAAMSLIPEGRHTEIAMQDRHSGKWKWGLRGGYGVRSEARAETAPRAITAAALRARNALNLENARG